MDTYLILDTHKCVEVESELYSSIGTVHVYVYTHNYLLI